MIFHNHILWYFTACLSQMVWEILNLFTRAMQGNGTDWYSGFGVNYPHRKIIRADGQCPTPTVETGNVTEELHKPRILLFFYWKRCFLISSVSRIGTYSYADNATVPQTKTSILIYAVLRCSILIRVYN